jgi:hypothetical protein
MHKGFAEEAIVIVKRLADEERVTYRRIKPIVRAKQAKVKGGTR